MRITERFEAINCKPEEMFFEQISQVEKLLEKKGYICTERFSYGTYNLFYHKEGETVVFVTYYNTHNKVVSFTTMSEDTYLKWFANSKKKVAFTLRTDGKMKAIVSMNGTYVPLAHLAFDCIPAGYCVDHIFNDIRFNDSSAVRLATSEQNSRNRSCSKKVAGDDFDYDASRDFREKWWLVLCVTMFHEITWEQAKAYNMGGDVE